MNSDFQHRSTEGSNSEEINFHPEKKSPGNRITTHRSARFPEGEREEFLNTNHKSDNFPRNKDVYYPKKDKFMSSYGYGDGNVKPNNPPGQMNRENRNKYPPQQRKTNKYNPNQDPLVASDVFNQIDPHNMHPGYYHSRTPHYRSTNPSNFTRTGHAYPHPKNSQSNYPGQSQYMSPNYPSSTFKHEYHKKNVDFMSYDNSNSHRMQNKQDYKIQQYADQRRQLNANPQFDPTFKGTDQSSRFHSRNQNELQSQVYNNANTTPSTELFEVPTTQEDPLPINDNEFKDTGKDWDPNEAQKSIIMQNSPQSLSHPIDNSVSNPELPPSQFHGEPKLISSNDESDINSKHNHSNDPKSEEFFSPNSSPQSYTQDIFNNKSPEPILDTNSLDYSSKSSSKNLSPESSHVASPSQHSITIPSSNNDNSETSGTHSSKGSEINSPSFSAEIPSPATSVSNTAEISTSTPANVSETPKQAHTWKSHRSAMLSRTETIERQVKSLLNKLTIERFPTISEQLCSLEESLKDENEMQLFVNLVVGKAVSEHEWLEMYADLCLILLWRSPHLQKPTSNSFKSALIAKIQTEFVALPKTLSLPAEKEKELDEYTKQLEIKKLKNHILGVITLIGELFQRKLIAYRIVQQIFLELVINNEHPDEHIVECFLQLISTTGYHIDQNESLRGVLDLWFGRLKELHRRDTYSTRLKCVIQNVLDLRKANWLKKIHKDTAKGLNEIRGQLAEEMYVGGAIHRAAYGNIVTIGKPINAINNTFYANYLKEQENRFKLRTSNSS